MTLEKQKEQAAFLDTQVDEETLKRLEKWNLALLGVTLLHDLDHIIQARRWKYHIPLQLWVINLAVYVLPTVSEFLIKNKRASSFGALTAANALTTIAFLKVHFWKPTTDVWGIWNYNYFKLNKGVLYEGKWIQGIKWYDWALLLDLPALAAPAIADVQKLRKAHKEKVR